jgi:hypothetical protein
MNLIRRSAWAAVMLGAVAGCTGGEDTTAPTNVPANNQAPAGERRPGNPAAKSEPSKDAASKEMQPPPPPPDDAKKGDDMKKPGTGNQPKLQGPQTEGKGDTAAAKLTPDEIATIKQLPAADQELALKQVVCPVSDGHLGEMGKPYKISVEGRTVFLCCDNCEKDIKADPKKFLAKLDAQPSKK